MRILLVGVILGVLVAGFPACSASHGEPVAAIHQSVGSQGAGVQESESFGSVLDQAISQGWKEVYLDSECRLDVRLVSLELFGNGVGIWDGRKQFSLSLAQIRETLEQFKRADFAGMEESFGGKNDPIPPKSDSATEMTCRIALTIDGLSKQVIQLEKGRQSKELKALAEAVFSGVQDEAEKGIQAESLSDGLEKIAQGTLAPETFHLMLHRKPDPGADASKRGWLMRIDGTSVSTRVFVPGEGYREPAEMVLLPTDFSALVSKLQAGNPQGLPTNLYAEKYTDFSIRVLNWEKKLQARRFAGMTPTTHGARQQDFDQIYRVLSELHAKTLGQDSN